MNASDASSYFSRIQLASAMAEPASTIRELRVILETIFRKLTAGEKRAFNGLYARTQFIFDTMQVPSALRHQVNGLRILANKVAHEHLNVSNEELLLSIEACAETASWFSGEPVPTEIKQVYESVVGKLMNRPTPEHYPIIASLRLLVIDIEAINEAGTFILLVRADGIDEFKLQIRLFGENDLRYMHKLLKPYQTLHVMQIERVGDTGNFYRSTARTMVVLEPDLLISISELAECFLQSGRFPLNFLVKKLVPQSYSEAAFQGNMVNALLDMVIKDTGVGFKETFKEAVADQVFQAAAYGKDALNRIYKTVNERHWQNVYSFASGLNNGKVRLEPSFFAPQYGIEGRLDVLVEYPEDLFRKDIYELKSGRAPFGTVIWPNNQIQVVGYHMLLRSVYGQRRSGVSAIIYSAAQENPVRHVITTFTQELELMEVRNHVVAWMLELAAGNFAILNRINMTEAMLLPTFSQDDYQVFENLYHNASEESRSYYQAHLSFVIREWLNARIGMYGSEQREDDADGFAGLWLYEEAEKREAFNIIPALQFEQFDVRSDQVTFKYKERVYHNFREGDTVLLYPKVENSFNPLKHQILKGRLDEIKGEGLVVSLNNRQLDSDYFLHASEWVLEHDMYESSFWVSTRMLLEVLDRQKAGKVELLLGERMPEIPMQKTPLVPDLNPNQREVVEKAFCSSDYFLIQGPPGTGKTSTVITNLVRELAERQTDSIMVVAFTNRAVNEIEERLNRHNIAFLKLGSRRSEAELRLRQYCLDGQIQEAREFIVQHKVFLCTVATLAGRLDLLRNMKSDLRTIIVDEASQLTEAQLAGLLMQFKKIILVGDQNQLPPVVAQHPAFCKSNEAVLQDLGADNLAGSLFERLMRKARIANWRHAWEMLNTHFRMHDDIADIINPWYGGKLESGTQRQQDSFTLHLHNSADLWSKLLGFGRLLFVPSPKEMNSKFHIAEAQRVVEILKAIRTKYGKSFSPRETVGVVTPWRTQIARIRQLLAHDEELSQVNIDTVERFQGSENEIVIVSLAVYHSGQLSMLESAGRFDWIDDVGNERQVSLDRKLLVTISRAKQQLILLADESALRSNIHYYNVLRKMKRFEVADYIEEVYV